jgi:hypothetical protein
MRRAAAATLPPSASLRGRRLNDVWTVKEWAPYPPTLTYPARLPPPPPPTWGSARRYTDTASSTASFTASASSSSAPSADQLNDGAAAADGQQQHPPKGEHPRKHPRVSIPRSLPSAPAPTHLIAEPLEPCTQEDEDTMQRQIRKRSAWPLGCAARCKHGRGLHSSTFQLNLSALYGIGGVRKGLCSPS